MTYTHTLTSKGQITLPKSIRETLGLKPGDQATFRVKSNGEVVVERPKTLQDIHDMLGKPTFSDPLTDREKMILQGMKRDNHKALYRH